MFKQGSAPGKVTGVIDLLFNLDERILSNKRP